MSYKSKITSFEDACNYLGEDPTQLPIVEHLTSDRQRQTLADYKRPIIAKAINKEANGGEIWVPDYTTNEDKWYAWMVYDEKISGFRFSASAFGWPHTDSHVGPRLSFITEEAAIYFYSNFNELHNDSYSMDKITEAHQTNYKDEYVKALSEIQQLKERLNEALAKSNGVQ